MPADDRFFVDTNLLLYCYDSAVPQKRDNARVWLDRLWDSGQGRVSWQVLHEFSANAERRVRAAKQEARTVIESFALWDPVENSLGLVRRCRERMDDAPGSYCDGLILAAAEQAGCAWLLSEDFQAGRKYGSVTVVNPFRQSPKDF